MATPVIETEGLTKVFGRLRNPKLAVDHIHFRVEPGQVYGFLGPNGAGKSTTIRMILNLMYASEGKALVFGEDPRKKPEVLYRVGSLVEGATFYPYLRGWDNLKVVGNSRGGFDEARAKQLLQFVGLVGSERVRVKAYSTGMKQRLGIAAALLNNPDLVILDEPTNGMDPSGIREMRQFIRDLAYKYGKTVFLTSHLLSEVQQTSDRVAIVNKGKIVVEGRIDELLNQEEELEVEVGSLEKAKTALQERWLVIPSTVPNEPNRFRIKATRNDTPSIVRRLVDQNVDVFGIAPVRQSLEDYFLEVTGDAPLPLDPSSLPVGAKPHA
ncbi:MAG: ABC transporter ATP-binding protein [Chloroflexi bacterium]|nr:ABC transporter ATP-binding protein [Chloroflexota bacterium]